MQQWIVNVTFFDSSEYNSLNSYSLKCTSLLESEVYAFWVFCASLTAVTGAIGLVKVGYYSWVSYRHGLGGTLQELQQWNAKWLLAAITSTVSGGIYVYAQGDRARKSFMILETIGLCYYAFSILDCVGQKLTGVRPLLLKTSMPLGLATLRLTYFFYLMDYRNAWTDPLGLSLTDLYSSNTLVLALGCLLYLGYGYCLVTLSSQNNRALASSDYMIAREVIVCNKFVAQSAIAFYLLYGVMHLLVWGTVEWANGYNDEWYSFGLWLQDRNISRSCARMFYVNLFAWAMTLALSPRHHSSVSTEINIMEVPFSTFSWYCCQSRTSVDVLHRMLLLPAVPVHGYQFNQFHTQAHKFDLVLARLLARCSEGVYEDLHAGMSGRFCPRKHHLFDCRDPGSMANRAPRTRVVETICDPATDTNAAIFEQCSSWPCEASVDPGCSVPRLIVAFRGTISGTNIRTDVDTNQIRYDEHAWVHQGFANALSSISAQLHQRIDRLAKNLAKPVQVCVCGHSLGGALAALFALELAKRSDAHQLDVRCYTFGQPRFGDRTLAETANLLLTDYWRVNNLGDPVCRIPGVLNLKGFRQFCGDRQYTHAGNEVQLQPGGQMIFSPNPMESYLETTNVFNHLLGRYEVSLEACLRNRWRWLWRKAQVIVRMCVVLQLSARTPDTERNQCCGHDCDEPIFVGTAVPLSSVPHKATMSSPNPLYDVENDSTTCTMVL
eukprot:TRINITY_DN5039_c0_g1_i1.p1 TRINITY_DN5039_c0_g1~~TRINITY_DN5039_c0_g1_i1.p1  ORF type:complete len:721 (+),score=100.06 TRINITY_DN5039_c0_g1_i1:718-2880(+)